MKLVTQQEVIIKLQQDGVKSRETAFKFHGAKQVSNNEALQAQVADLNQQVAKQQAQMQEAEAAAATAAAAAAASKLKLLHVTYGFRISVNVCQTLTQNPFAFKQEDVVAACQLVDKMMREPKLEMQKSRPSTPVLDQAHLRLEAPLSPTRTTPRPSRTPSR